jgi:hypothetical protein
MFPFCFNAETTRTTFPRHFWLVVPFQNRDWSHLSGNIPVEAIAMRLKADHVDMRGGYPDNVYWPTKVTDPDTGGL